MKQQSRDFAIEDSSIAITIKYDNTSAVNLTKNSILHSRAKHIEMKHHFIKDHVQNGDVNIQFINSKNQLTDIFTKSLVKSSFEYIRNKPCITYQFLEVFVRHEFFRLNVLHLNVFFRLTKKGTSLISIFGGNIFGISSKIFLYLPNFGKQVR